MNAWTQTASCGAETLKHAFVDTLLFVIDIKSHFCMNSIWQDIYDKTPIVKQKAGRKMLSSSHYLHTCLHLTALPLVSLTYQKRYSI